jgi:hypothetical protein
MYNECRYAECHYTECHGALLDPGPEVLADAGSTEGACQVLETTGIKLTKLVFFVTHCPDESARGGFVSTEVRLKQDNKV